MLYISLVYDYQRLIQNDFNTCLQQYMYITSYPRKIIINYIELVECLLEVLSKTLWGVLRHYGLVNLQVHEGEIVFLG